MQFVPCVNQDFDIGVGVKWELSHRSVNVISMSSIHAQNLTFKHLWSIRHKRVQLH